MRERLIRESTAVALILGAILLAVALASHSPLDPSPLHLSSLREHASNLAGWIGATLSAALLGVIGVSSFVLPPLMAFVGWRLLRKNPFVRPRSVAMGWLILLVAVPAFAHLVRADLDLGDGSVSCGGLVGRATAELLLAFAGSVGRLVLLAFLVVVGVLMVSGGSAGTVADRAVEAMQRWWRKRRVVSEQSRARRLEERNRQRVLERQMERLEREQGYRGTVTVKELEGRGRFRIVRKPLVESAEEADLESEPVSAAPEPASAPRRRPRKSVSSSEPAPKSAAPVVQEEFDFVEDLERYDLPKTSFLDPPQPSAERDSAVLIELSKLITSKCQEFKVRGEVVNIRSGPIITTYEFRLDPGVKISAVQNLAEDLALALRVESVRIERIPGRATVGIEVPNPHAEDIRLRHLVEASEFQHAQSLLTLCLGVDIHGKPFLTDLSRAPHLLIGGFTGSGKSVGLNAMIMSILYKARPDQVKFILVDPKMVELGVYSDIPHLLTPIISDPKKAANALGWAVAEMDNRYRLLAALGVRKLAQYNQLVQDPVQLRRARELLAGDDYDDDEFTLEHLPYVVIVIDELAELMMTSSRAVEESITRLSQKARAVGVHLICATQRPSVDILTGIIKANFPARIAYKVRSKYDSKTILDATGAEHLLGRGDMLLLQPGTSNLIRLHGPLVTEKEIATVVRYATRFGKPEYQREVLNHAPLGGNGKGGKRVSVDDIDELTDPMFDQAARLVVKTRKASASYIQRRLHLGYTRSARLLDMMEKDGLVGPLDGSKGREVLVPENYFGELEESHAFDLDDQE